MHITETIRAFTVRHPFIGPAVWILSIQYYVTQVIVAKAWTTPFSLMNNPISDLGNTACGVYAGRYVCSPLFGLMNASFILLGISMAIGSLLIYEGFKKSTSALIGFSFMATAGLGTVLVGLFPENSMGNLHTVGAILPFLIGNLSLIVLSQALYMPKTLRYYTFFSGLLALTALILLATQNYLGIGIGGMERIVAYPQTTWLIVFGIYVSSNRIVRRFRAHNPA